MPKVVYVDDDHLVREVICGKLAQAGYPVVGFGDPVEFLAATASTTDGCIVLDLYMPGLDGLQVQGRLRELGCNLPVIFYSGAGRIGHAVEGMRAGAVDFLQKSSEVGPLLRAIQALIGEPEAGGAER